MKDYPYADIGERLKQVRGNISQSKLAALLGMKQQQYNRYEMGKIVPPFNILERIADYGNVSFDWLLFGKTERTTISDLQASLLLDELTERLNYFRDASAVPKNAVSDDEMAIIRCLRLLKREDTQSVLHAVLDKLPPHITTDRPKEDREALKRVQKMIDGGRPIRPGIDYEDLLLMMERFREALMNREDTSTEE